MEDFFQSCNVVFEGMEQRKDELKPVIRGIQNVTRALVFQVGKVHLAAHDAERIIAVCEYVTLKMEEMKPLWKQLAGVLGDDPPERHRGQWRNSMQQIVFVACLTNWLQTRELLTIDQVAERIGVDGTISEPKEKEKQGLSIDLEDYLHGLAGLPKELSRLSVNCVRGQNYDLPREITAFVNDLYSGFRLLNLRNDALRRRFDGIKYDLQRLEEVLYDVQVRGLGAEAGGEGSISASAPTPPGAAKDEDDAAMQEE